MSLTTSEGHNAAVNNKQEVKRNRQKEGRCNHDFAQIMGFFFLLFYIILLIFLNDYEGHLILSTEDLIHDWINILQKIFD